MGRTHEAVSGGRDALHRGADYIGAYRTHTDLRAERDPQQAVGCFWDELGQLQFDYLVANGMQPHHTLLDRSCGNLRGGRHAIRYLASGHYTGLDLSASALAAGRSLLEEEGLAHKEPRLIQNDDLTFREVADDTFDFLLAQSVFTHLKPPHIEECFAHVGRVLGPESVFFFTYGKRDRYVKVSVKDFGYPFSFFEEQAARHGFEVRERDDYDHPRGQVMVEMRRQ